MNFEARLEAVDRLAEARKELTGRFQVPLVNAGAVFLAAATEAFVEELYKEAVELVFPGMTAKEFKAFFAETAERFHAASIAKTELLYFHLGMELAFKGLSFSGFTNDFLRSEWKEFLKARNRVAHGAHQIVSVRELNRWRKMLKGFVPVFESRVANLSPQAAPRTIFGIESLFATRVARSE